MLFGLLVSKILFYSVYLFGDCSCSRFRQIQVAKRVKEMDPFESIDYYNNLFNDIRIPRTSLRDAQDPYTIPENEFKKRYRFSQATVKDFILPLLSVSLSKPDHRGCPISPELQILVCLRFYATASFQIVCADLFKISQPAVSNIVSNVSHLLAELCEQFIRYPQDTQSHRLQFNQLGQIGRLPGLPSIDGAIDCVHIKIVHTPGVQHHEAYRNRKSFFSINVQAVAGPRAEFLNIVARWAGSTHDSRIFQLSALNMKYREGHYNGLLVGDNGYPSLRYLITPINPPTNPAEQNYNKVHVKTRNVVERMFGMWKRRFPCLSRGLGNKLSTVADIIVACAVLHNMALQVHDDIPEDDEVLQDVMEDQEVVVLINGTNEGFAIRNTIVHQYYSN